MKIIILTFKKSKSRMHELCEKHLQTLKKQTEDANVTEHGQPPGTGSHQSRPVTDHRQAAAGRNVNLRTRRR